MALSVPELFLWSRRNYGQKAKKPENTIAFPPLKYADYIRDTVVIDTLLAAILGALAGHSVMMNLRNCAGSKRISTVIFFRLRRAICR